MSDMAGSKGAECAAMAKVLRANVRSFQKEHWNSTNIEDVVAEYQDFIVDALRLTARPTVGVMTSAAKVTFGEDLEKCKMFAVRMQAAISYCRVKAKSATSGMKLSQPVRRVVEVIVKAGKTTSAQASLGPPRGPGTLWKGARALARKISEASSAGVRKACLPAAEDSPASEAGSSVAPESPPQEQSLETVRSSILSLYGVQPNKRGLTINLSSQSDGDSVVGELTAAGEETQEEKPEEVIAGGKFAAHNDSAPPGEFVQYTDSVKAAVVRRFANGAVVEAKMCCGPGGFAMAEFPGDPPFESEVPNAYMQIVQEKSEGECHLSGQPSKSKAKGKAPKGKAKAKGKAKGKASGGGIGGKRKGAARVQEDTEDEEQENTEVQDNTSKDSKKTESEKQQQGEASGERQSEERPRMRYAKMWYKNGCRIGIRRCLPTDKKQVASIRSSLDMDASLVLAQQAVEALHAGDLREHEIVAWLSQRM